MLCTFVWGLILQLEPMTLFIPHLYKLRFPVSTAIHRTMTTDIKGLFPLPHRLPVYSYQTPSPLPGVTHESATQLVQSLELDMQKHHIYFNDKGFHK